MLFSDLGRVIQENPRTVQAVIMASCCPIGVESISLLMNISCSLYRIPRDYWAGNGLLASLGSSFHGNPTGIHGSIPKGKQPAFLLGTYNKASMTQ